MIDDAFNSWKFKTASQKDKKGPKIPPEIQPFGDDSRATTAFLNISLNTTLR